MLISLRYILPLIIFIALAILLSQGFSKDEGSNKPMEQMVSATTLDSTIKQTRKNFRLKSLTEPGRELTQDIFKGKVTILTVWASWCAACRVEQDKLLNLSKQLVGVSWVGLNINDSLDDAQRMLQIYGNPYQEIIYDPEGRLAIDLGIRGTPALLVLDKNGGIYYRHYGSLNTIIWQEEILPLIKSLEEG